jgi:N-acetylglutamate synthase-like GNAT family acetyltransferase
MNFSPDNRENLPRSEEVPELKFEIGADGYFGLGNEVEQVGLSGKVDKNVAMLTHIIVSEKHRGKDYGKKLIQELEEKLRSRSIKIIYAFFRNEDTAEFLSSQGYSRVGIEDFSEEDKEVLQSKLESVPPYLILLKKL